MTATNLYLNLCVHDKDKLELRRIVNEKEAIKSVLFCAINDMPIAIFPTFKNKIRAIAILQERGIIKYDKEKKEYVFLI